MVVGEGLESVLSGPAAVGHVKNTFSPLFCALPGSNMDQAVHVALTLRVLLIMTINTDWGGRQGKELTEFDATQGDSNQLGELSSVETN